MDLWLVVLSYLKLLAGILWIGLLQYWSLFQAPVLDAGRAGELRRALARQLLPELLWALRWMSLACIVSAWGYLLLRSELGAGLSLVLGPGFARVTSTPLEVSWLLTGALLGSVMLANRWCVIDPIEVRLLGADRAEPASSFDRSRAELAARATHINSLLSFPLILFLIFVPPIGQLGIARSASTLHWLFVGGLVTALELSLVSAWAGARATAVVGSAPAGTTVGGVALPQPERPEPKRKRPRVALIGSGLLMAAALILSLLWTG